MVKGEKATFVADPKYCSDGRYPQNCPSDQISIFEVELIDFYDKEKGVFDYTKEERIPIALNLK